MTTHPDIDKDPVTGRAHALFEARVEDLDAATANALRTRRRETLAQHSEKSKGRSRFWWPAGGMVAAALALALWLPVGERQSAPPMLAESPINDTIADDGRALDAARFADNVVLELEDDADFYAWLATVPDDDSTTPLIEGSNDGWTL
jgi:hypothetical protein